MIVSEMSKLYFFLVNINLKNNIFDLNIYEYVKMVNVNLYFTLSILV